jgi:hypothetical protein
MLEESRGLHRVLYPSVLGRFPKTDRLSTEFPHCIDDFFFDERETVITAEMRANSSKDYDQSYESMGLIDQRNRHRYVTTHLFLEDLSDI